MRFVYDFIDVDAAATWIEMWMESSGFERGRSVADCAISSKERAVYRVHANVDLMNATTRNPIRTHLNECIIRCISIANTFVQQHVGTPCRVRDSGRIMRRRGRRSDNASRRIVRSRFRVRLPSTPECVRVSRRTAHSAKCVIIEFLLHVHAPKGVCRLLAD